MKKSVSINLSKTSLDGGSERPLIEVIDEAIITMLGNGGSPAATIEEHLKCGHGRNWLIRRAIRAVCAAIIKAGGVMLPISVELKAPANAPTKHPNLIERRCVWGLN